MYRNYKLSKYSKKINGQYAVNDQHQDQQDKHEKEIGDYHLDQDRNQEQFEKQHQRQHKRRANEEEHLDESVLLN